MDVPEVAEVIATICTLVYVPATGLKVGAAAVGVSVRVSTLTKVVGIVTALPEKMTPWLSVSNALPVALVL